MMVIAMLLIVAQSREFVAEANAQHLSVAGDEHRTVPATRIDSEIAIDGYLDEEGEIRFENDGIELIGTFHAPAGAANGPGIVVAHGAGLGERDIPLYTQIDTLDENQDPWSVSASWNVIEEEVRFENENDGIKLTGTLFSPEGVENAPALVVVQQAGTETRDNSMYVQIAETFNAIGYSVFLYDRRGTGESEGGPGRPRYLTMAEDAVAGKRAIARSDAVDPERIGFWGVSQGGWLAMEAAAMSTPAFVISLSAPLTTPGEQMKALTYNMILVQGYGREIAGKALEARIAVMDEYFRGKISYETAYAVLAEIEDEPWFEYTYMIPADELPRDIEETSWIHEMDYDPVPAYEAVEAPLLFLLGGEDFVIPVGMTIEIAEEIGERETVEMVVIPGADHGMQISETFKPSNSVKYFMVMGEWLGRHLR